MTVRVCFALFLAAAIACAAVTASALEGPSARSAIVAWVTAPGQLEPLQTVGGWRR